VANAYYKHLLLFCYVMLLLLFVSFRCMTSLCAHVKSDHQISESVIENIKFETVDAVSKTF